MDDKGTSMYVSNETKDVIAKLAKFNRRSIANMAEKLALDELYRLPQEVRAQIDEMYEPQYSGEGLA